MDELFKDMLAKGLISIQRQYLTIQQTISYLILTSRYYKDYLEYLDYDEVDWLDWCKVSEN